MDELHALGCPERFSTLADAIPALLDDHAIIGTGHSWSLSHEQVDTLRLRTAEFQKLHAELAAYRVPLSLEHGDFWANNVAVTPDGYLFFDWSDASISHPFFSLAGFLRDLVPLFPNVANLHMRLINAYLEPWTCYAPMETLQTAFALARVLAQLHFAITYQRDILPQIEARWEMERMVPYYLATLT
ncbi:MAG TPA: phosphotransferase [Ktedonobacterales bacterium]